MPPYRVGARAAVGASLPTASTDPARVMALPPASRRILLGSRHQEGDLDCSSTGIAEPAAEGQQHRLRRKAGSEATTGRPGAGR
jgi:hypothetical protein